MTPYHSTVEHLRRLLHHCQTDLAPRVAGEAEALAIELPKLHPDESADALRVLTDARNRILDAHSKNGAARVRRAAIRERSTGRLGRVAQVHASDLLQTHRALAIASRECLVGHDQVSDALDDAEDRRNPGP